MASNYHEPTFRKLSGNVYYNVVATKPLQLANRPKKVERRSTATSDFELAGELKHTITQAIYSDWGSVLKRVCFTDIIKHYWDDTKVGNSIEEIRKSWPAIDTGEKVVLIRTLMARDMIAIGVLNEFFEHLSLEETRKVRIQADCRWGEESPNRYPVNIQQRHINEGRSEKRTMFGL
jgi:hypothetical protein